MIGKRIINTRLHRNVTIREENAITALEVMSRFAANPKWLIYLPPTMSPCETSKRDGLLEHPEEAFAYYLHEGVHKVVCEQKHMGSRAVVVVCRDADAARKRFGIMEGEAGVCYTRTGRRFFNDAPLESQFLERVRKAVEVGRHLGGDENRLGLSGLRIDAVVSQGTRVAAAAICSDRGGGPSGFAGGDCCVESGRGES